MNKKLFFLFVCVMAWFCNDARAAITGTTLWEVRPAGTTTSGGGYDSTISGATTDLSIFDNKNAAGCSSCQSATVNISTTDAVTANSTTVTSATGNFSSALIGNTIYLTGTGTTTGWYQVTAVGSSVSITVDRATGSTGGTGVTMNIGGALAKPCDATAVVGGNTVYMKAGSGYTLSASCVLTAGAAQNPVNFTGYTTTRGDNGMATFTLSGSGINGITFANNNRLSNIIVDCAAQTTSVGVYFHGTTYTLLNNAEIKSCKTKGINADQGVVLISNTYVHGGGSGCTTGIYTITNTIMHDVRSSTNACAGVIVGTSSLVSISGLISDGNTGATSDGLQVAINGPLTVTHSDLSGNARDGLRLTVAGGDAMIIRDNIMYNNAGVGLNSTTTVWTGFNPWIDYNAFGANGTVRANWPAGAHDVTLGGSPFTSSSDFSLNSTAGAGAALKGTGYPGALIAGGTGYADIGALQSQGSGGGATQTGSPIVR